MKFGYFVLYPAFVAGCAHHKSGLGPVGPEALVRRSSPSPLGKTAIMNVRVFDGAFMSAPRTLFIDQDRISANAEGVNHTINAAGKYLIPGLIDSHLHLTTVLDLEILTSYGVTTALQMACRNYTACNILRDQAGLTDFYTAGVQATGPDGNHAKMAERLGSPIPSWQLVINDSNPVDLVNYAFGNGSNYYKITVERGGPSQDMQNRLVRAAHSIGQQTMSHASDLESYQEAIASRSDGIQHTPDDGNLTYSTILDIKRHGQYVTPTIEIFKLISNPAFLMLLRGTTNPGNSSLSNVFANVRAMHRAGVPILAGTDAVGKLSANITFPFGLSLHNELQNLVDAGMTPAEAINAATRVPAMFHRLKDRGFIAPGMRADLLLLNSNPLVNISNTLDIESVWAGGRRYVDVMKLGKA